MASHAALPYEPVLTHYPDARLAKAPLFDPLFCGYLAPLLGSAVAALPALYNAILLRRARLALAAIGLGVVGRLGFLHLVDALWDSGFRNVPLLFLAGRLLHLALGVLLAASQWSHVQGHRALEGKVIPLFAGVLVTFLATQVLPWKVLLFLLGIPVK